MKNDEPKSAKKGNSEFIVTGKIERQQAECEAEELQLMAFAFDASGKLLGVTDIDQKGQYSLGLQLTRPAAFNLLIGPGSDAQHIRHSSAFRQSFTAGDWEHKSGQYRLKYDALLPLSIWRPWWPQRICINGHIRKVISTDDGNEYCPVPFVKVEVFDVDREACLWPFIRIRPDLVLDRPVIRLPELIEQPPRRPPFPRPFPDPVPELTNNLQLANIQADAFEDNLDEPAVGLRSNVSAASFTGLNSLNGSRVGEVSQLKASIASRIDKLTVTSLAAPWIIFPHCFYSRSLVCETTTDCNGYFNCCFNWWPFHFRRGRLRFDARPDIIIRVTQVINGVSTVIYMDPYTSTRWNTNGAHIDLFLDNEEVICGNGECYTPPEGSPVFFTRIGDDEVYQINQSNGLFNDLEHTDVAYGSSMKIHGQFGDLLTRSDPESSNAFNHFYYRLSYALQGSDDDEYKYVDTTLSDSRVGKGDLIGETHKLGPFTVNGNPSLYEVRNFNEYYWYNPDLIGLWNSVFAEKDTGLYILRLEVFDENGNKLNTSSGQVDYRNGAGIGNGSPPAPLPIMVDHADLVMRLDNKRPNAELEVQGVTNACGVIPWSPGLSLTLRVNASQENNRLSQWVLWYTKGVTSEVELDRSLPATGPIANVVNFPVDGTSLIAGLETTCAYALRLRAWSHVRNGRDFIYIDQDIDAIAIEKCS